MRRLFYIAIFNVLFILQYNNATAQDPFFSQAYLSPIYLNPAATGAGEYDLRVSLIHRRQSMSIPSKFNYSAFSIDKFFPNLSSGFGLLATNSSEGFLQKNGIYFSYAYTICAGTESVASNGDNPRWFWSGGLQFGMQNRRIDYSKLVFADELDVNGVIPNFSSQADYAVNNGHWYPDFSAGTYFNYNLTEDSRLLAGFSAHHINKPDESLSSTGDTSRSQLPARYTGNLMYTYTNPDRRWSWSLSAISYMQAAHHSYQAGIEVTQDEYDISLGAWLRSSANFKDLQTLGMSLSFNISGRRSERNKTRFGIAHDAVIGSKGYSYTAGSTEAAFVWDHGSYNADASNPCKPRISSQSVCPIQ